ncbi:OmpL47-type beta-barrel domain-containing protein, partial [Clostridium sporogenes]|uniref:OmpL47-type beta-barrel domain-containing protein n=1 Tax=Clostridium sporogenes TaxID=1509 RepID=UPI0028764A8B
MKPYNKKVINKKITQALIGVTTLGTVLAIPISIDKQDNSIGIIRENKVFAADTFKGITGNVEWISGNGLPMPTESDLDDNCNNDTNSVHNQFWNWSKQISWTNDFQPGMNTRTTRGGYSVQHLTNFMKDYNKYAEADMGWRPVLEIDSDDPLIKGRKTGDIVKFGTLYRTYVWDYNSAEYPQGEGTFQPCDCGLGTTTEYNQEYLVYKIGDTSSNDRFKIRWVYIKDGDKNLLIAKCNLIGHMSYDDITKGHKDYQYTSINSKTWTIEGKDYFQRLVQTSPNGDNYGYGAKFTDNEWDRYISMQHWRNNEIPDDLNVNKPDKEAPKLEVIGNLTEWTNQDVILNASAKDNNKVKSIILPDGKTISSDKADFTVTKNGTYKFIAEDEAGNKTTKEIVIDKIDKELPTLNLSTSIKGSTNGNVDINIDAKDSLSGIKEIKVNGTVITGNKYTVSTNGIYTVESIDNAGNKISKPIIISNIDRELPNGTITADKKSWTNGNVTLTCTATDNIGVKSITLPDGKVITGSKATFAADKNGKYDFIIEDISGNKRTVDYTVSNIDKELPTLNLSTYTTSSTNGNVDINIDAKDTLSGVKEIKVNGTVIKGNKYTVSTNGTYTVEVIDNAGNKTSKQIGISNIDKELPTIAVSGNPTEWTNNNVVLNIIAKDNIGVKSITLPDGKVVNSDKTDFTVNKNGTYKFMVEDEAGNKSTKEVIVNKIDKELPLININVKGNKMTITATDNLSGVKEVFYKVDDGEFVKYEGEVTLSQGTHTIKAKVIDNADNSNDRNGKFIIDNEDIDKELPTLEVSGNPIEWTNKDIILNVTAKDNKKVKSITFPNGKVVNGDKTTFTVKNNGTYKFMVEDEAGNKTTKEVSVNRIDKELPTVNINVKDDKMTIAASDKLSGIKEIFYKIDNGEFVRYTGEVTLSPGAHKIKVKAIDNAGNMNDQNSTSSEVNVSVEDKSKKDLEDATKAVEKAETTKNEDDIDRAKEKVAKLPDGKDKDDLNNRLDDLEKQIKAEKDAYIKAYNAVKKAKTTLDKEDYEYAKKAVYDLNTTIYKNEKAQLQRVLDALKPYIDRKENEKKQAERNKIRNIEKLISKAIATKDTKTIEEAQAAIDELEDFDIKMALQKKLDTTNKISQMDLAIQARDAVEKLDAYLNYSDVINNLDELKDLYKKGEKATNRLDNSSQYKNRMDKAKSYIEVIETLAKYKGNAEKNNILASEKEMTELISKANQLSFTT